MLYYLRCIDDLNYKDKFDGVLHTVLNERLADIPLYKSSVWPADSMQAEKIAAGEDER